MRNITTQPVLKTAKNPTHIVATLSRDNAQFTYSTFLMALFLTIGLILSAQLFGNPQLALLDSAQVHYENGFYSDAIADYTEVMDAGYESTEIYYNIGNSFFKQDNIPAAILYYEKALKLAPADEDILYNLNVANSRITDRIEPVPEMLHRKWLRNIANSMDTENWSYTFIALFLLFLTGIGIYFLARNRTIRKIGFLFSFLLLIASAVVFSLAKTEYTYAKETQAAIIFEPSVTIKSSPSESSTDLFVLHDGTKVDLIERVGDWYKIKIASGSIGWIEASAIQEI